jgi:hypothetical protein
LVARRRPARRQRPARRYNNSMKFVVLKRGLTVNIARVNYANEENGALTLHFTEAWMLPLSDPQDIEKLKQNFR